jgi:serine/threonine-protein kinase
MVDKKPQVVYVSDAGTNEVYGYSQSGGSPFITISGFSEPQGLATDNIGSVYVADTDNSRVQVFPAGSTTASLTINDAGEYPAGVAVLGNYIYVTNIISTSDGAGGLVSFNKKTGTPYRTYSCDLFEAFFVAADKKGDVFVDGFNNSFDTVVVEFPQASTTCTTLPISISFPGGLQVDKSSNLVVDDQEGDTKSYAPPGYTTVVATSDNGGSESYDPVTIALNKGNANIWTANAGAESLTQWPYPASGTPSLTISGFSEPIGVATYERGNK